jgi:hypothetical protein
MIADRVAILHPDLFHSLLAYQERYADLVDPVIARFEREAQMYLGYLSFIQPLKEAGLSFCLPEISLSAKEHRASDTFDLALAGKLVAERRPVVVNDLELGGAERILVVSGPRPRSLRVHLAPILWPHRGLGPSRPSNSEPVSVCLGPGCAASAPEATANSGGGSISRRSGESPRGYSRTRAVPLGDRALPRPQPGGHPALSAGVVPGSRPAIIPVMKVPWLLARR